MDIPCGFCDTQGCPDCGGIGYLVTDPRAAALLEFIKRHLPAAACPMPGHPVTIRSSAATRLAGCAGTVRSVEQRTPEGYLCRVDLESGEQALIDSSLL